MLEAGREAERAGDVRELLQADARFHEMIYRWSGNAIVQNSMRVSGHHIRRAIAEVLRVPRLSAPVWDEHGRIVEALLTGEATAAEALMKGHIETAFGKLAGHQVGLRIRDGGLTTLDDTPGERGIPGDV